MENLQLNVQEIKELMSHLQKTGLESLKLQQGEFAIEITAKQNPAAFQPMPIPAPVGTAPTVMPSQEAMDPILPAGKTVKSPIVGTFYSAPAPDKPPFVAVGQKVHKGDVLFIVESMKLMNEVESEYDGEVVEILVSDGEPLEYGQPVMVIE